jgi:hypothetical protein
MKKRVPLPPHGKKVDAISWDIGERTRTLTHAHIFFTADFTKYLLSAGYVAAHSKAMPLGFKF